MQANTTTFEPLILDLGCASAQTLGPYSEGPIEIMGHRAPAGLSED
jgi:hypothetical protein